MGRHNLGDETPIWGDSAYAGQKKLWPEQSPYGKDFTQKKDTEEWEPLPKTD